MVVCEGPLPIIGIGLKAGPVTAANDFPFTLRINTTNYKQQKTGIDERNDELV